MKLLNLKEWKAELHDAELDGIDYVSLTRVELQHFISEIENLRKKVSDQLSFEKKKSTW